MALSSAPSARLLAIIHTQNEIAASRLDLDAVMGLVVDRARDLTGADGAAIELADDGQMVPQAVSEGIHGQLGVRTPIKGSLSGLCVEQQRVQRTADALTDARLDPTANLELGARSMVCAPLRRAGMTMGVLQVHASTVDQFVHEDEETVGLLATLVAAHMQHELLFGPESEKTRTDALTGLPNRLAFDERLAAEVDRARRYEGRVALCLFDVVNFTRVNELLGYQGGNLVLRRVGELVSGSRVSDSTFHLGADHFALVLPEGDAAGAETTARRIGEEIAAAGLTEGGLRMTHGVAETTFDAIELVQYANARLQNAKQQQRAAGEDDTAG